MKEDSPSPLIEWDRDGALRKQLRTKNVERKRGDFDHFSLAWVGLNNQQPRGVTDFFSFFHSKNPLYVIVVIPCVAVSLAMSPLPTSRHFKPHVQYEKTSS